MNENKICKIEDEALQNVAGGKDDKKYYVGDAVKFEAILAIGGAPVRYEFVGTITKIDGNLYTIKTKNNTYIVEESAILGNAVVKIENGAYGGWN